MKIALIAMSGVRAQDEELMNVGMTLPGFVERSQVIASLPSLGLLTLAGMTPDRHEVQYYEVDDWRTLDWSSLDVDLAAISSFTAQIKEAYELADDLRERGVRVVLGGLHVTVLPEEAANHADAVVVGEGEPVWRTLLEDAEAGRLRPLYDARLASFKLDESPMPAFELLDIGKYNRLTVQTSRGCPFHCEFCASSILLTSRYKQKPMERVLAEIDRILEIWPRPFIEFADDNSMINRPYWMRLLPEIAERRIRWFTETDLSVHEDEELLRLMRASGCVEVLIGFESPEASALAGMERKANWKHKRFCDYREAIQRIQANGIRVNGCFIVGLDDHWPDIFDRVLNFSMETELYDVQITMPTPFPGTPFYERLRREGRLLCEDAWERCTLFDLNFQPKRMSGDELRAGFRHLAERLYGEELTQWRRENFKRKYARGAYEAVCA